VLGRTVQTGNAGAGTELFTVETPDLSSGAYFFVLMNENIMIQRQVIIRRP